MQYCAQEGHVTATSNPPASIVSLPAGDLHYRVLGPATGTAPTAVFVHGLLTDSRIWDGVAEPLAARGVRCLLVTWPLGAHRMPMRAGADLSPPGIGDLVGDVLDELELDDVTLVGSDTGGAICQFLLDRRPERVASLVLANCDAFSTYPPAFFVPLVRLARSPRAVAALTAATRLRAVRQGPFGYGELIERPRDDELLRSWLEPLQDNAIRADFSRTAQGIRRRDLAVVSPRMNGFTGPVRLVWGEADRHFRVSLARRLLATFPDAQLTTVPGGRTFFFLNRPDPLVQAVLEVRGVAASGPE
jgi:pimeloyl-ACP methyl ester carboxylesterase